MNENTADLQKQLRDSVQKVQAKSDVTQATLEQERLLATRGLEMIKAQVAALTGLLPKVEGKAEGKIDIEKIDFVARLVGYKALDQVAVDIATRLTAKKETLPKEAKVMLVPKLDFASGDLILVEMREQIKQFQGWFRGQKDNMSQLLPAKKEKPGEPKVPPLGVAPIALAALQAASDIAGYFRTDYKVTGYELTIDREALVTAVAGKLQPKVTAVYIPNFYKLGEKVPIMEEFTNLSALSVDLSKTKKSLEEKIKGNGGLDPALVDQARQAITDSEALMAAFETYAKSITKAEGQDYSRLVQAALRDQMYQLGITHLLYLNVAASGGQAVIKQSWWRKLFGHGEIAYLSGTVASYVLATLGGNIVMADNLVGVRVRNCKLANLKFDAPSSTNL